MYIGNAGCFISKKIMITPAKIYSLMSILKKYDIFFDIDMEKGWTISYFFGSIILFIKFCF